MGLRAGNDVFDVRFILVGEPFARVRGVHPAQLRDDPVLDRLRVGVVVGIVWSAPAILRRRFRPRQVSSACAGFQVRTSARNPAASASNSAVSLLAPGSGLSRPFREGTRAFQGSQHSGQHTMNSRAAGAGELQMQVSLRVTDADRFPGAARWAEKKDRFSCN